MSIKEIKIQCTGYEISADWYDTDTDQVLLVLPGFTSTKLKYQEMIQYLVDKSGFSALVLDYAGHGVSPFVIEDLTRADNFSNVVVAFDWLTKNHPSKKITVLGTSYGGFHAAMLTKYRQLENVIFRVPASYPEDTMYTKIGEMDDPHSEKYRNNPDNYVDHWLFNHVDSVKGRAFVITHEFDDVCPPVATTPFAEAFRADVWQAPGFQHGFSHSEVSEDEKVKYYDKIVEWLTK